MHLIELIRDIYLKVNSYRLYEKLWITWKN